MYGFSGIKQTMVSYDVTIADPIKLVKNIKN